MNPTFFRQYADMIAEAEQPQQLDENAIAGMKAMATDLFNKAKAIPGFGEAYTQAKQMKPELTQILKSAKSGKEAIEQVKQLANVSESWGAIGTGIGSAVYLIQQHAADLLDKIIPLIPSGPMAALIGVPILIIVLAAFRSGR
jgi:hypothetical protein